MLHNAGMDLNAIAVFVKVVQAGSFSRAARLLGMPNTTVSAKVARLEKHLGVTLIQRTTRKLNVTPQGRAYFDRCVNGLEELAAGESLLTSASGEPTGLLRITAPVDVGHHVLPRIVREYLCAHPKVHIELLITNRRVDLVAEGVDLAIRAGKLKDSTLVARPFITYQGGLWASRTYVASRGEPKTPDELARHDGLFFSRLPREALRLASGRKKAKVPLSWRIAADDLETLRAFVLQGDGIGAMPDYLARDHAGEVVRVLPEWSWTRAALSFVYPGRRFVPPTVRSFIDAALAFEARAPAK